MENKKVIDSFRGEYRFLSNFWRAIAAYRELIYPTAEHAYQAAKSGRLDIRLVISKLETPGKAKRYGQEIEVINNWDTLKIPVMKHILMSKFTDPEMMDKLLDTGDAELIEGNHHGDHFWGVCNGVGENWLGRLLMEVRDWGYNGLTGKCLECRFGFGLWGICSTYHALKEIGSIGGNELEMSNCHDFEEAYSSKNRSQKIIVTEDIIINNDEVIPKDSVGYVKNDHSICFPDGVYSLFEEKEPVFIDFSNDKKPWDGKIKIINNK